MFSWEPMDYSLPGPSLHQISQARLLEWVAISFSRGSSQLKDRTHISSLGRQILYHWANRKACVCVYVCVCVCVCVCVYKYMHIYIRSAKIFIWVFCIIIWKSPNFLAKPLYIVLAYTCISTNSLLENWCYLISRLTTKI